MALRHKTTAKNHCMLSAPTLSALTLSSMLLLYSSRNTRQLAAYSPSFERECQMEKFRAIAFDHRSYLALIAPTNGSSIDVALSNFKW